MGVEIRHTPLIAGVAALAVAVPVALHEGAERILDASQPLVPVEEGILKASGRVEQDGITTVVTYGRDDDGDGTHAPSNQYVIPVHENLEANHPNGGQAKFLEDAASTAALDAMEAVAMSLRAALGL